MMHLLAAYMLNYGSGPLQTDEVFPGGPTVVALVHGGGFLSDAQWALELQPEAKDLQKAGFTAVIVNYGGGTDIASEVSDVVAGAQAVHATTLIGGSAGGTLVAYAAEQMPVVTISLSGDLDPAASLAYWSGLSGQKPRQHVIDLRNAGVTSSTVPPVLTGTTYVYASASEAPIVVSEAEAFGAPVTLVPGTKHSFDYWKSVRAQVEAECK